MAFIKTCYFALHSPMEKSRYNNIRIIFTFPKTDNVDYAPLRIEKIKLSTSSIQNNQNGGIRDPHSISTKLESLLERSSYRKFCVNLTYPLQLFSQGLGPHFPFIIYVVKKLFHLEYCVDIQRTILWNWRELRRSRK